MKILDAVTCGNDFTEAATIEGLYSSPGGYFAVTVADVYAQLQYGNLGQSLWTPDVHIPVGTGALLPGTTGIKFKNYTAGSNAVVSAALATKNEPAIAVGAGTTTVTSNVTVLAGTASKTVAGTTIDTTAVVFSTPFSAPPMVVIGLGFLPSDVNRFRDANVSAVSVTVSGFTIEWANANAGSQNMVCYWIATPAA